MKNEKDKLWPLIVDKTNMLYCLMFHCLPSQRNVCFLSSHTFFFFLARLLSIFVELENFGATSSLMLLIIG